MMSRMLRQVVLAIYLCAATFGPTKSTYSQEDQRPERPRESEGAGNSSDPDSEKPVRPEPNSMRIPKVSPEMMDVLRRWEVATAKIDKLQGEHVRRIYDSVFKVEKFSVGKFYFEAPNKGRIDISVPKLEGNVSQRKDRETGKNYKLEADRPESWICDGAFIFQVNEGEKLVEGVRLPAQLKGRSIVDAPLPFLFGMPAEKAIQRYVLAFSNDRPPKWPKNEIWLDVKPRTPLDAAEWSSAKVILDTQTFLPHYVKMIDPSGNLETVYTFQNCIVNKIAIIPWKNPFQPPRIGYKINIRNIQPAAAMANNVPSAIGLTATAAQKVIEQSGFEVEWIRGDPAKNPNLKYVVYEQSPGPREQLNKGETVKLTVYDAPLEIRARPIQQTDGQEPTNK